MKLAIEARGAAWWRPPDRWRYGLLSIEAPSWWHVGGISLSALDFDFAPGFHFDSFSTARVRLGPVVIRLLFIDDLGGGYVESPY